MSTEDVTPREQLEHQADVQRSRLANTLAALDRRRHRVQRALSPVRQARLYALPLAGVGVAIVVGFAAGELMSRRRLHKREEELRGLGVPVPREDVAALSQPPMLAQIMRSAAISLVSVLVSGIARRALARQLLPARDPEEPPAIEPGGATVQVLG
jgi:hypothetical protein